MTSLIRSQQQENKLLQQKIPEFQVADAPISLVLQRLARSSNVPVGVELLPETAGQRKTITVRAKDATVRSILDLVLEQDPQYLWQPVDPVINIFPKNAKDPLLETIVGRFKVKNMNKEEAIRVLENSIEVKKILAKSSLRDRTLKSLPGDSENNLTRFSLDIKNASVRSILNSIMVKSAAKSWVFFRYGAKNDSFSLLMR